MSMISVNVSGAASVTMAWSVATAAPSYDGSQAMTHVGNTWSATLGTGNIFDTHTIGTSIEEPITITFTATGAGGTKTASGPTITLYNASECIP